MKVAWATEVHGIGDQYGFSKGNQYGRAALEGAGVTIDPDAHIAVHHCPPHAFRPIEGRFNVLYTAWEFLELPDWERETLDKADYVLVTASFLVDVFDQYVLVPIEYVPQGIDVEAYWPGAQKLPSRKPFRALWVGAANDRKGWQFVMGAWQAFASRPDYELYVKTTAIDLSYQNGNIIVNSQDISQKEMRELYQSADVFLFPSMGEGFGFTLGEAMACGLPCIYTPCTALTDMANPRVALPLKATYGENFDLLSPDRTETVRVEAAEPDATDLALKILWVKEHKAKARKIGRRAAAYIRQNFTWPQSGIKLRNALARAATLCEVGAET